MNEILKFLNVNAAADCKQEQRCHIASSKMLSNWNPTTNFKIGYDFTNKKDTKPQKRNKTHHNREETWGRQVYRTLSGRATLWGTASRRRPIRGNYTSKLCRSRWTLRASFGLLVAHQWTGHSIQWVWITGANGTRFSTTDLSHEVVDFQRKGCAGHCGVCDRCRIRGITNSVHSPQSHGSILGRPWSHYSWGGRRRSINYQGTVRMILLLIHPHCFLSHKELRYLTLHYL